MSTVDLSAMMTEDDFLEHAGVKGMKWGKRKAESPKLGPDGNPAKTRSELRDMDKASRKNDVAAAIAKRKATNAEIDGEIDAARNRQKSGANKAMLKDAKTQYKIDRAVIGKREAKKALAEVRNKTETDYYVSQLPKSGKEATLAVLGTIAATALVAYVYSR